MAKVTQKTQPRSWLTFQEIGEGRCFLYQGNTFMKIVEISIVNAGLVQSHFNAINLANGSPHQFGDSIKINIDCIFNNIELS